MAEAAQGRSVVSFMDELPGKYRAAVEASPWYSTLHDIAFYAVDPTLPCAPSPWAESGKLRAVLRLDGQVSEFPLLERAGSFALGDGVESGDLERAGVAVAEVNLGDYVTTCDLLERWFSSLTAA